MTSETKIFNCAVELLLALNKGDYWICDSMEEYFERIGRVLCIPYAYAHIVYDQEREEGFYNKWFPVESNTAEEFYSFLDDVQRIRDVLEHYNHNNELMWTTLAYIWENRLEHGVITFYEQDCMDDDYYIEMGRVIKNVLKSFDA